MEESPGDYLNPKSLQAVVVGTHSHWASQVALVVKNPPANARDTRYSGSVPGSGRFPGGGNGNQSQYSCLETPIDRGAWWAMVHWITESDTTEVTENTRRQNPNQK